MPNTLTTYTNTEINKAVTKPIFLIELGFSPVLRWSTQQTLEWNSLTWTNYPVRVTGPNTGRSLEQTGRLTIPYNPEIFAIVAGQETFGRSLKIWQLYGDGPYAVGDAKVHFDGVMDGDSYSNKKIEIEFFSFGAGLLLSPRILINQIVDKITPSGTTIEWNNETYILEGE